MQSEIIVILDKSGSMTSIRKDAIGGFNAFLTEQKKIGDAKFSLVLFSSKCEVIHDGVDLKDVPELTEATYIPQDATALYDAIGNTVATVQKRYTDPNNQPRIIVAILTDGEENSSIEYSKEQILKLITELKTKQWEFIFLAANQDAFAASRSIGVAAADTYSYQSDSAGTKQAYAMMAKSVRSYRQQNNQN
jgi:Mg-chelatase subunit ChlD